MSLPRPNRKLIGVKIGSRNLGLPFSRLPPDLDQVRCRANKEQRVERCIDNVHQAEDEFGKGHEESNDALP